MRTVAALLAICALAPACDGGPLGLSNFVFSARGPELGDLSQSAVAAAEEGAIRVNGEIGTPDACHEIDGRAFARAGGIEIRVRAVDTGGNCGQAPARFEYEGILLNPDPGTYTATVRHIVRSSSTIAFEEDIEVH